MAVELAMFVAGVAIYARATRARNRTGTVALWAIVALLFALYLANAFAPVPPGMTPKAVMVGAFAAWIFFPWAHWIDRNRQTA
jgi:hypothetical protein